MDGNARGRVVCFLLSLLKETTKKHYANALEHFNNEMLSRGLDYHSLSETNLDWVVAEYLVEKHDETDSSAGLAAGLGLVASLAKQNPRIRLVVSNKVLDVWRVRHPPRQAPAIPLQLLWAVVSWLVLADQAKIAALCVICFCGLLRASEALSLTSVAFVRGLDAYIAVLGRTKRGLEQKVVISDKSVIDWLDRYFRLHRMDPTARLFKVTYNRFNFWLRRATDALGFGSWHWSTHSLRRGGATAMLIANVSFKDIQLYGRWLSERSCREYLRRGEVQLSKMFEKVDVGLLRKVDLLSRLGASVFDHYHLSDENY